MRLHRETGLEVGHPDGPSEERHGGARGVTPNRGGELTTTGRPRPLDDATRFDGAGGRLGERIGHDDMPALTRDAADDPSTEHVRARALAEDAVHGRPETRLHDELLVDAPAAEPARRPRDPAFLLLGESPAQHLGTGRRRSLTLALGRDRSRRGRECRLGHVEVDLRRGARRLGVRRCRGRPVDVVTTGRRFLLLFRQPPRRGVCRAALLARPSLGIRETSPRRLDLARARGLRAPDRGTFLVATTYLADGMDVSRAAPELQTKAAEVFPKARQTISKAIEWGAKVACGTDAPAIPHGKNAKELVALVQRGMTPVQAIRAATTVSAELIDKDDRGRLAPGLYADIIGVPGDPTADIGVTEQVRFVMKGGQVYRQD